MTDEQACCGACAHLARVARDGATTRPETPPLRFELGPDGAPRGAVVVVVGLREFPLQRPQTIVGRGKASDIDIADQMLSRRTARFVFGTDGQCFIEDMQSTCGVLLNDQRVDRAGLHEGDEVRLGNHIFRVERR